MGAKLKLDKSVYMSTQCTKEQSIVSAEVIFQYTIKYGIQFMVFK